MAKNHSAMKKIFTIAFTIILSGLIAQKNSGDYHLDKIYKMEPNGTLTMNSSDAKVFITGSSRKDAHVKIDRSVETRGLVWGNQEFTIDVSENNGGLTIRERSSYNTIAMVGYTHEKYTINIDLPEGASLTLRGDDGDYFIKLVHGAINVNLDDADIELAGCLGNEFKFRIDDGDIKMDEGCGSLTIDADDADVRIENARFTTINADIDDGDFVVETSLADGGDYYINSQDGLIALTVLGGGGRFDIRHDDARVSAEGPFEEVEKSESRSRLTLGKGNARVEIRADDARIRLAAR